MGDIEPAPHSGNSAGPEAPPSKLVGPVVAPDKKDTDAWKEITKKVADEKILFEPMAAINAANECQTAIGGILGLQKAITDMGNLKSVSHLQSGGLLAVQFNGTLRGLNDVLETHKQGLNTMLNTFKAAANKFIDAELDSESGFDKATAQQYRDALSAIKAPTKPGKLSAKPKDGKMPSAKYMDNDDDPVQILNRDYLTTGFTKDQKDMLDSGEIDKIEPSDLVKPAAISKGMTDQLGRSQSQPEALRKHSLETGPSPENPDSQKWHDLYELGQSTGDAVKSVHHAGTMWDWMAGELDKTVGTFATNLMNTHGWSGPSAKSAQGAVKNYHTKATGLSDRMKGVGANLKYTSEWLADTQKGMPTDPNPPKVTYASYKDENASYQLPLDDSYTAAQNNRDLAIYRQNMENNYVQGVQTSSNYIPALDELPTTGTKKPPGTDKPGAKQDNPGPSSPGPSSPGPSSPGQQSRASSPTSTYTPTKPPSVSDTTAYDRSLSPAPIDTDTRTPTYPSATDTTSTSPTSGLDGLGQAADLAQQGMGGAQSAMQAAAQAAQQAAAGGLNAARAGLPSVPGGSGAPSVGGGGGASKIGGGAGLSSGAASALQKEADAARLFPRANAAGPASPLGRLNGIPGAGVPASGTPGSPGAGAGQGQGQNKDYKRPKNLESKKHLEQALGDAPAVAKAVVEK